MTGEALRSLYQHYLICVIMCQPFSHWAAFTNRIAKHQMVTNQDDIHIDDNDDTVEICKTLPLIASLTDMRRIETGGNGICVFVFVLVYLYFCISFVYL